MVSKLAELIYNTYLRVSRTQQGKPFRYRQDFTDFEDETNYVYVAKLELFFKKFPHIKIEEFFKAPYVVYTEKTYYSLDFYIGQKAIKVYTMFNKQRNDAAPDSEAQLEFIRRSLIFILDFCQTNKLQIEDYITHMNGLFPSFLTHLKEHNISIYVLFAWDNFENIMLNGIRPEELQLFIGHLYDKLVTYRTQFVQSKKAKEIVRKGVKIVGNQLASTTPSNK